MHNSVMDFVAEQGGQYALRTRKGVMPAVHHVLEVGSYNENGSIRPVIEDLFEPQRYVATDMRQGPGVDFVVRAEQLTTVLGTRRFQLVLCLEMLEHAQDWHTALYNIKQQVAPNGLLILSTRSPGFPYHGFPADHWRFTKRHLGEALADMAMVGVEPDPDPDSPGVFALALGPSEVRRIEDDPAVHVQAQPMEQPE